MTCLQERQKNNRPILTLLAHCSHFKGKEILWYILPYYPMSWEMRCKSEISCSHKTRRQNRCQQQDILPPTRASAHLHLFLSLHSWVRFNRAQAHLKQASPRQKRRTGLFPENMRDEAQRDFERGRLCEGRLATRCLGCRTYQENSATRCRALFTQVNTNTEET
jgi:hypothetical protein